MRLFEIIDLPVIDGGGVHIDVLSPTNETYPSRRDFVKHAKLNGEKYTGKRWLLLSGGDEEIIIEEEKQYKITFEKSKAVSKTEPVIRDKD